MATLDCTQNEKGAKKEMVGDLISKLQNLSINTETPFKEHPTDPHTKLYPTLENRKDYLHCTDANHAEYRFDIDNLDKATDYLLKNGYVVIKKVLNDSDLATGKKLLWDLLSSEMIGWDQNDYKTWNIYKIGGELQNGLIWGKGMGQSKFQWFGRTHPNTLKVFSHIWSHNAFPGDVNLGGSNESILSKAMNLVKQKGNKNERKPLNGATDLITSFDGIGIFTPWYLTNVNDRTNSGWYHIDQNVVAKKGIHTIQGYLSYFDQNESTGSTCLIPNSHLDVADGNPLNIRAMSGDFIRVRKGSKFLDSEKYKKILVCCKAGDMVLWDSRTIHCNSPALLSMDEMREVHLKKRKSKGQDGDEKKNVNEDESENENVGKKEIDFLRLVGMICMVPKYRLKNANKKSVIKKRVDAYINQCTSSHWPTEFNPLSQEFKWNDDIKKNDIEKADDIIKSLIGYT